MNYKNKIIKNNIDIPCLEINNCGKANFKNCTYFTSLTKAININSSNNINIVFTLSSKSNTYDLDIDDIDTLNIMLNAFNISGTMYSLTLIDKHIIVNNNNATLSATFTSIDLSNIIKFSYNLSINPIEITKRICTVRNKLTKIYPQNAYISLIQ
jgi:hypothetical protein